MEYVLTGELHIYIGSGVNILYLVYYLDIITNFFFQNTANQGGKLKYIKNRPGNLLHVILGVTGTEN